MGSKCILINLEFFLQLKILLRRNYYIKLRHFRMTLMEYICKYSFSYNSTFSNNDYSCGDTIVSKDRL